MNTNAAVKYFKQYREENNISEFSFVPNGEVLLWLAEKLEAIETEKAENSYNGQKAVQEKSLQLLDEYFKETPPEEVQVLVEKHRESLGLRVDNEGVHQTHCCKKHGCKKHGCKYSDEDCPVVLGSIKQDYECELGDEESPCFNGPIMKNAILFNRIDREDYWVSSGLAFKVKNTDAYEDSYNEIKVRLEDPELIKFIIEDDCLEDGLFEGDDSYAFVKTYWNMGLVFIFRNSEDIEVEHRYSVDYIYVAD